MYQRLMRRDWFRRLDWVFTDHMWKMIALTFLVGWSVAAIVYHV